jgi:hypothetical protein
MFDFIQYCFQAIRICLCAMWCADQDADQFKQLIPEMDIHGIASNRFLFRKQPGNRHHQHYARQHPKQKHYASFFRGSSSANALLLHS